MGVYHAGVARFLHVFREPPRPCSYLSDRLASHDIRLLGDVSPAEYGELLARGWRRFGQTLFRPACGTCDACMSVRIPVATFRASRSQRRARRAAGRLIRGVGRPDVDDERVSLYARWHAERERRRGWERTPLSPADYAFEFGYPHPSAYEVSFREPTERQRLVGLGLVDAVPGALSAVIFFWDPQYAPPSLGVAHVVMLVEQAAAEARRHVYLGYHVAGCASLAYKSRYLPHEALCGRPRDAEPPLWTQSL